MSTAERLALRYDNSNDVLGDYSLTLVDTLDTLAMIGTREQFHDAVQRVLHNVSFDKNNKVQVFEVNIRALDRFLPAFYQSKSGIPYPRVNLRHGVPRTETEETCTAGAGSLILEFGVLSRLTGNPEYERVAKKALLALWDERSDLDLMGNVLNIQTLEWIHPTSSTGAGIDSFFEYLLKAYVLFGEEEYLALFDKAHEAIRQHIVDPSGYLYRNVHMDTGALMATWIDSLSAFMPGLQVLYGDVDAAVKGHLVFYNVWRRYHALPERFDFFQQNVDIANYPLRPEFIESNYYLYRATHDPFYLHVGAMVLRDLNNRTRIPCGFASLADVQTGRMEDRMESFMLSETLKYLYLLFDDEHPVNSLDSNFVFSTEGHFLTLAPRYLASVNATAAGSRVSKEQATDMATSQEFKGKPRNRQCPRYSPLRQAASKKQGASRRWKAAQKRQTGGKVARPRAFDLSSVPYLPIADCAADLVHFRVNASDALATSGDLAVYKSATQSPAYLSRHGQCASPSQHPRRFELTFGIDYRQLYAQLTPKFVQVVGGILSHSLSGLRLELQKLPKSQNGGFLVTGG
ncbi:glycoside hydrolase [Gongronella butleri]|nr:glycoside hydrolase [Gongronella butleri]